MKSIESWIELSFTRYNQIMTISSQQKQYKLHTNEDINRFLNDLCREIVEIVNLPMEERSFRLVNKLLQELIEKLSVKEYLFKCTKVTLPKDRLNQTRDSLQIIQLNLPYFTKHQIYIFTPQSITLNLDSQEVQRYILAITKKFITNQLEYLQFLQNKI